MTDTNELTSTPGTYSLLNEDDEQWEVKSPPLIVHHDQKTIKLLPINSDQEKIYESLESSYCGDVCDTHPAVQNTNHVNRMSQHEVIVNTDWVVKTDIKGSKSYLSTKDGSIWNEALSKDGRKYFYNIVTEESLWHLPNESRPEASNQPPKQQPVVQSADSGGEFGSEKRNSSFDDLDSFSSDEDEKPYSDDDQLKNKSAPIATQLPTKLSRSATESQASHIPHMHCVDLPENRADTSRPFPIRMDGAVESRIRKKTQEGNATNRFSLRQTSTSDPPDLMTGTGKFNIKLITKDQISLPLDNKITMAERKGPVVRTKLSENNQKVPKKWVNGFMVLSGPQLFIYRDQKAATPKTDAPFGKPDITMQVKDLICCKPGIDDTTRKNVLLLRDKGAPGSEAEYLIMLASQEESNCWEMALKYSQDWDKEKKYWLLRTPTLSAPKKVDNKLVSSLLEKLIKRPSREELEKRGLIKTRPVFGANLVQLCHQEQSNVPSFVSRVIHAIELRGLDFEGLYRKNVPGSRVQVLRIKVDSGQYTLNSEDLEIEALTGALKMFMRELSDEGIITKDAFRRLTVLGKMSDTELPPDDKLDAVKDVLESMPSPHLETCRTLFHHFYRVISEPANKMSVEAIATVIGPNVVLANLSGGYQAQLTLQNSLTAYLIKNTPWIFGEPRAPPLVMPSQ